MSEPVFIILIWEVFPEMGAPAFPPLQGRFQNQSRNPGAKLQIQYLLHLFGIIPNGQIEGLIMDGLHLSQCPMESRPVPDDSPLLPQDFLQSPLKFGPVPSASAPF